MQRVDTSYLQFNMMAVNSLSLITFNVSGLYNDRILYTKHIISEFKPDVMLLQETWLLNDSLSRMNNLNENYLSTGKSAVPSKEILHGRPYGGVGFLWNKSLAAHVTPVPVPSDRIAAITISQPNGSKILIVNIYMPCDNRMMTSASAEYEQCIEALDELLISVSYNDVIIGGDMNTDYARNNAHAKCLTDFCMRNNLKDLWHLNMCDRPVTYVSSDNNAKSCIDHYLTSRTLSISTFGVIDEIMNSSNHFPVYCTVACPTIRIQSDQQQNSQNVNIAWHRVTDEMYSQFRRQVTKSVRQAGFVCCLNCEDLNCESIQHRHDLDKLCQCMEDMLVNNALQLFPKIKKRHAVPYWNQEIRPLKNDSIFWHWLWRECGKPSEGIIVDIYKRCKKRYHYAIKNLKKQENILRNARMAEAIVQNNSRDLWKEINKMKPRSKVIPPHVDGCTDNKAVCDIFANKYQTLFNSVPSNKTSMRDIKDRMNHKIRMTVSKPEVTIAKLKEAISKLKSHKSDGDIGLISDMIIQAPDAWLKMLADLVTSMLCHGYCPEILCKATITSLVKDRSGDLCCSSNYRGIALSSAINKVIDWLMLLDNRETLITNNLQFAFKPLSSTSMCTLALKEIAAYYTENGGNVFCTMLDASKAFDRLRYDKLFQILENRQLEPLTFRYLLYVHEHQLSRTQWLTETSDYFTSQNGIRQGGVISPVAFTIYMDELIHRLENMKIGCYIGREFYGTLCYADDVTIVAPTISALQKMVDACEQFGHEYDISYNAAKSYCLQIGGAASVTRPSIILNGKEIQWSDTAKHLGNVINSGNNDNDDIKCKKNDFVARSNSVFVTYCATSRNIKTQIFQSKCCGFYGSQIWKLNSRAVEDLHLCWRKVVRRLLGVPRNTRSALLHYLLCSKPFMHLVSSRFLKMLQTIHKSDNNKMKWLVKVCSKQGTIYTNIEYISKTWEIPFHTAMMGQGEIPLVKDSAMQQRAGAIIDFMDMDIKNNDVTVHDILYYLCTY